MQEHPIVVGKDRRGKILRFRGSEHVALLARTGSGKTAGFTIPNCFDWEGSLLVLDIKREAFAATAGHREVELGQPAYLFDPAAPDGRSHRWNPFDVVERDGIGRFDQIIRMGSQLFPEAHTNSASDRFWFPAARSAFIAVAALLAESPEEPLRMDAVLRAFTRADGAGWLRAKIDKRREDKLPYSRFVVDGVNDYLQGDIRQVDGIRKSVSTQLQAWSGPSVVAATAASDFDLRDLRRRPMTVYVAVSPGDIARMAPLLRLFFDQAITLNTIQTPQQNPAYRVQTLILLDEFARLGPVDRLAEAASYVRSFGLRMAFVAQTKAALHKLYGDGVSDIFGNIGLEIIFGTNDLDLAREVEARLGTTTVGSVSRSKPSWFGAWKLHKQTESEQPHARPLLLAQEVMQMPEDEQIMLRPGMLPGPAWKLRWFDDARYVGRWRNPPTIPRLAITVPADDGGTTVASVLSTLLSHQS